MRRLTISFDLYQYELLKSQAQERGVSIADIVRELVDKYMASTVQTGVQNKNVIA
jgi:negative regulator of replication initiation